MRRRDLGALFAPASVAIVGASNDVSTLRGRVPMQMLKGGYGGNIWPVHPREREVQGLSAYPSLAALPDKLDLALIIIPADKVIEAVEQAADAGARAALVYTSGFAEEGTEIQQDRQRQLAATASRRGISLIGPNSVGFLSTESRLVATFSPSIAWSDFERGPGTSGRGRVAIVSQSGGLAFSISLRGAARGLSFSKVISTGNEADADCVDVLEHLIDDPDTRVVILFLESVRRGRRFIEAAHRALTKGTRIIAAKVGRSAAGSRAAASHTASLTGADAVFDAVALTYGIDRVDDIDAMIDLACGYTFCPTAKGRRVGIVTVSGGVGGWMSDAAIAEGLEVPEFSASLQRRIREYLPSYGSAFNPVDVSAQATQNDHHIRSIETVIAADEVDQLVVVNALSSDQTLVKHMDRFAAVTREATKPVLMYSYPLPKEGIVGTLAGIGYPVYLSLPGCARTLRALADRGDIERAPPARPRPLAKDTPLALPAGAVLTEFEAKALLSGYGIAGPPQVLARTAADAVSAARGIGFPVALKIQSPAIPHKTEIGGVMLGLADPGSVEAAFATIMAQAVEAVAEDAIDGILVQSMAGKGIEVIVGAVRDPVFGPIVTVGMGGIYAEILSDTQSAPAPIDVSGALELLKRLKAWPLLDGARGQERFDTAALAEMVAGLSRFAFEHASCVVEVELNPVIVQSEGGGASAVDALIVAGAPPIAER
jgi:acyl-CoA synthetase (NDP forming)